MKVGDLVQLHIFKNEVPMLTGLVLKVDADLIKVALGEKTVWMHKEHLLVVNRGK